MSHLDPHLLDALGLPPQTVVHPVATSNPASFDAAIAEAAGVPVAIQRVLANLSLFMASLWTTSAALPSSLVDLDARHHREHPGVVILDGSSGRVLGSAGAVSAFESTDDPMTFPTVNVVDGPRDGVLLVLDGREVEAVVALETEDGVLVVRNARGRLSAERAEWSENGPNFSDFRPSAPLAADLVTPTIPALLEGCACPTWLRAEGEAYAASVDSLARVAGLGLVGRLWSPSSGREASALLEDSARSPGGRVRRWAESLPRETSEQLGVEALAAAGMLHDLLTRIDDAPADADDLWPALIRARDDAASLSFVLSSMGRGAALSEALLAIDDRARTALTSFAVDDEVANDPRWRAVASAEPESWWGCVVDG